MPTHVALKSVNAAGRDIRTVTRAAPGGVGSAANAGPMAAAINAAVANRMPRLMAAAAPSLRDQPSAQPRRRL